MSFTFIKQLPSPDDVKSLEPMSEEMKQIKAGRDRLIQDVITGASDKFLVIIGPCSADNEDAVCEYTNRLARVQEKVQDRLVLVPRIYTNKPRRIRRPSLTSWPASWRSAICTYAPLRRPD